MMSEKRESGIVKWFHGAKGYGFISRGNGQEDVFVHFSQIRTEGIRALYDGEKVKFTVTEGEKGLHANEVVKL